MLVGSWWCCWFISDSLGIMGKATPNGRLSVHQAARRRGAHEPWRAHELGRAQRCVASGIQPKRIPGQWVPQDITRADAAGKTRCGPCPGLRLDAHTSTHGRGKTGRKMDELVTSRDKSSSRRGDTPTKCRKGVLTHATARTPPPTALWCSNRGGDRPSKTRNHRSSPSIVDTRRPAAAGQPCPPTPPPMFHLTLHSLRARRSSRT